jgi:hypothetical protein
MGSTPKTKSKPHRNRTKRMGDILRYRSRPRHRGEILCHNHVAHVADTLHGERGFRYFVAARGDGWVQCPCGWQPASGWKGAHYAQRDHVKLWKARIKRCGSLEAAYREVNRQLWEGLSPQLKAAICALGGL